MLTYLKLLNHQAGSSSTFTEANLMTGRPPLAPYSRDSLPE